MDFLKYNQKYHSLKQRLNARFATGIDELAYKSLQIPVNFPKQKTDTPDYYKFTDGTRVPRFSVPDDKYSWVTQFDDYDPTVYTNYVTLYHNVLMKNPWVPEDYYDPSHKEFVRGVGMTTALRGGWADPEDIDAVVPLTTEKPDGFDENNARLNSEGKAMIKEPTMRLHNMSTRQEIEYCQEFINKCLKKHKIIDYGNSTEEDRGIYRQCINNLTMECVKIGIKLRYSYTGPIQFNEHRCTVNPIGRTGIIGRGTLGNWGPNHAADPVVCRANPETGRLQFALIRRAAKEEKDREWGLPGGMVEAGQTIANTRTKEFAEEALASDPREGETVEEYKVRKAVIEEKLKSLFSSPQPSDILYMGVCDDPRNTDNSWMETVAILTVLEGENANLKLQAGDDADKAKWTDYHPTKPLFASHKLFIDLAVDKLKRDGRINEDLIFVNF